LRQGGHQVAQKLTSTTLPSSSDECSVFPSSICTENSGTSIPFFRYVVLSTSLCAEAMPPQNSTANSIDNIFFIKSSIYRLTIMSVCPRRDAPASETLFPHERSYRLTTHRLAQIAGRIHVEHDDRQSVLPAQREGRQVHNPQSARIYFPEGNLVEPAGIGMLLRVGIVNTVHPRSLEQYVGLYLDAAERRRTVGREIGIGR